MRPIRRLGAGLAALGLPGVALAHSPIEGVDGFFNGVLHPVFVPAHLLALLVLGLLFGQQGFARVRAAIIAFAVSIALGLLGAWLAPDAVPGREAALLVATALVGLLVALDRHFPVVLYLVTGSLLGALIGLDSSQEMLLGREKIASLLGTGFGAYLLLLYPLALAEYARGRGWQGIGVKVFGSWLAASALLVLALTFLGPGGTPQQSAASTPAASAAN